MFSPKRAKRGCGDGRISSQYNYPGSTDCRSCGMDCLGVIMTRAIDRQVGGNHYKDMPLQPIEYIMKNKLGFCEGNVVKYITRYASKGGVEDLRKVIHYTELLIEEMIDD